MAGTPHSPAAARNLGASQMAGGTLGGQPGGAYARFAGRRGGISHPGDALYLWTLVALEVLAIGWLRTAFRRYHGG